MGYRILADVILVIHFSWVLFALFGFIITLLGFFWKKFFDKWVVRTIQAGGILLVGILTNLKKACPLTLWENTLRAKYDPSLVYRESCIIFYVKKLLYPNIDPSIIRGVTTFIASFSIIMFIVRPPKEIKRRIRILKEKRKLRRD
jgi:energy-coupling factor transporter transmembrane protein EcfT